jgi:hypothetical protein
MRSARPFERLTTFARFQKDEANDIACCRFVSEQERADGRLEGVYDCATCPVAAQAAELEADAANAEAWRLFTQTITRFSSDLHLAGVMVDRMTAGMDPEDFADLMRRFGILYDVLCPPPEPRGGDEG